MADSPYIRQPDHPEAEILPGMHYLVYSCALAVRPAMLTSPLSRNSGQIAMLSQQGAAQTLAAANWCSWNYHRAAGVFRTDSLPQPANNFSSRRPEKHVFCSLSNSCGVCFQQLGLL